MKKGVIFDMDGTLLDTERFYAEGWLAVAESMGLKRNSEIPPLMSGQSWSVIPQILKKFYPDADTDLYVKKVIEYCETESEKNLSLMKGAVEILEYFKSQNIPMAVASSSFKATIEKKLRRANLYDYFKFFVAGDEVSEGKPSPETFLKAAEKLNLPPKDCYVFEDSSNGVRAGVAAGCTTIMIPDRITPPDEIKKICDGIFDNLLDALEAIKARKI